MLEGWPPSLKSLSLPELSAVLEECVGEMGKVGRTLAMWRDCCAGGKHGWVRVRWFGVVGRDAKIPACSGKSPGSGVGAGILFLLQILGSASSPGDRSRLRDGGVVPASPAQW